MPNKIQVSGYAETIREILITETEIRHLVDVSNVRVFKESSVYPNILLGINRRPNRCNVNVGTGFTEAEQIQAPEYYFFRNQHDFLANPGYALNLTKSNIGDLLERLIVDTQELGMVCNLHAGTTGFSASDVLNCLCEGPAKKGKALPFIVTGNIDPFFIVPGNVRYMKQKFDNPFLRHDPRYITDGKWRLFSSPKIVIAGMAKIIEAAYDSMGYALGVNVYAATDFKMDYRYILALLNSDLLAFIFKNMFQAKHLAGGYLAINKGQLSKLPIKRPPENILREIINLMDRVLHCVQSAGGLPSKELTEEISGVKIKLDEIVYKLYGLSDADVELIKQSS